METDISAVCAKLDLKPDECIPHGFDRAKIDLRALKRLEGKPNGKLILVTAINPTPAGEGKTTVSIGLAEGLQKVGKKAVLALREPSLGPVFGVKGGATGGGKARLIPSDDIDLHFTGDFHAITSAHNLLSALIDNHIFQGNELGIERVVWPRTMDMNDRSLRIIDTSLRKDSFVITAASEIMAVLALSNDLNDLKERINTILIGYTKDDEPVLVRDLGGADAMTVLLREAMKPNLVRSTEGVPALVHAGPFANIAHGCNSIVATKLALKLGDYAITEAGFGADLGMEKFLDLKMPLLPKQVDAVVLVATLRALKSHGGAQQFDLPNMDALVRGIPHLAKHLENITRTGLNCVIALNFFPDDDQREVDHLLAWAKEHNYPIALAKGFTDGGAGMVELAHEVVAQANLPSHYTPLYLATDTPTKKIEKIAQNLYGAKEVQYSSKAADQLAYYEKRGWNLPVCIAKTPLSFSGDPTLRGVPTGFTLNIEEVRPSLGAGFLVALTKGIMVMPGLNKKPRAFDFMIDGEGVITMKRS
jgi:formate--tetrahydrofolate ligase